MAAPIAEIHLLADRIADQFNLTERVVTWPTGSEPSLVGVPDGTLWIEYTP